MDVKKHIDKLHARGSRPCTEGLGVGGNTINLSVTNDEIHSCQKKIEDSHY